MGRSGGGGEGGGRGRGQEATVVFNCRDVER